MVFFFSLKKHAFRIGNLRDFIFHVLGADNISFFDDLAVPLLKEVVHGHVGTKKISYCVIPLDLLLLAPNIL